MPMRESNKFNKGFVWGLAAGALGALLLYQKRHHIRASLWKLKAKAELYRRLYELKRLTRERFEDVIEEVIDEYRSWGSVAEEDLEDFAEELKDTWKDVKRQFADAMQTTVRKTEDDE